MLLPLDMLLGDAVNEEMVGTVPPEPVTVTVAVAVVEP